MLYNQKARIASRIILMRQNPPVSATILPCYPTAGEPEIMKKKSNTIWTKYSLSSKLIALALTIALSGAVTVSAVTFESDAASVLDMPLMMTGTAPTQRRSEYTPGVDNLTIEGSSVELDIGITVFLDNGDIASGYPFEFTVTPQDDLAGAFTLIDEDKDGQLYRENVKEGDYTIAMAAIDDIEPPAPITVTVLPKVSYEVMDVSDKVVSSKDIDASKDDKKYGGGNNNGGTSTPTPADTVEYVASSSKTETKTTETPVLDSNGNQVYKYKPQLSNGYLIKADGTVSDILATVDADGYITGAHRLAPDSQPAVGGQETPDPPGGTTEPVYIDVLSEVLDSSGKPLSDSSGTMLYKFEAVAQVETKTEIITTYYGWQTIGGKVYYYDKNGNFVTGWQTIQGIQYFFSGDGVRGGTIGIDISTWQENVNWSQVKAAGIEFAIIRLGFRGYSSGKLVLDDMYYSHMNGATSVGIKVGVYFFTQAITEYEAVEEASMCLQYVRGYNLAYPIVIDIEDSGSSSGRANKLTNEQRTKICIAFCETVRNSGYRPCVYANKYYLTSLLYTSQFESRGYLIWLAHYTTQTSYTGRYDIWQHSSKGSVSGIPGYVDMNISYIL